MSEGKKVILDMLKNGKITEDEALKLLDSLKETKEKNFSKYDEDFSKLLDSLTRNGKKIGQKSYDYIKNVDYGELKNKANTVIDQVIKAIDDFRITRL